MGGGHLRALAEGSEINSLPLSKLEALRQQIRRDLDRLDSVSQCFIIAYREPPLISTKTSKQRWVLMTEVSSLSSVSSNEESHSV